MANELSLNPADVDNMTRAVRLAAKRGAFEMEETAQLLASVSRLEQWVLSVKKAQEEAAQEEQRKAQETEAVSQAEEAPTPSTSKEKK